MVWNLLCSFCVFSPRQPKPKNRPSFRQILMHLDIAAGAFLAIPPDTYLMSQVCVCVCVYMCVCVNHCRMYRWAGMVRQSSVYINVC